MYDELGVGAGIEVSANDRLGVLVVEGLAVQGVGTGVEGQGHADLFGRGGQLVPGVGEGPAVVEAPDDVIAHFRLEHVVEGVFESVEETTFNTK